MNQYLNGAVLQVISIAVAAICGWLGAQVTKAQKKEQEAKDTQEAIQQGLQALLRRQILNDYDRYVVHHDPMSVERQQELEEAADAYFALAGNGIVRRYVEELKEVKPYIVTKE